MPPSAPTAGLYVHVPGRRAAADPTSASVPPDTCRRYLAALRREIAEYAAPRLSTTDVQSIHVGGGDAVRLSLDALRQLFAALPLSNTPDAEVTVEVSPADASPRVVRRLAALGVTRLSVAGHSFSPAVLRALDAPHTAEDVKKTIEAARTAGINTVALDLRFGMDALSSETWDATLRRAVALGIPHVSIVEAASSPAEKNLADQMEHALSVLGEAGYEHYSLTHFARPGHRSVHQTHYDRHGAFLGLGPSAASLWWAHAPETHAERWSNVEALEAYVERLDQGESPVARHDILDAEDLAREYILIRLRTREGLSLPTLRETYDLDLRAVAGAFLDRLRAEGLAHDAPDRVQLTSHGRLLTDAITRRLLSSL